MAAPIRICFVCLGNICRSPTAEGIFRDMVRRAGREHEFLVDSAGTGAWHAGQLPDPRTRAAAERQGIQLTHRARQFTADDFAAFDLVIAMDQTNQRDLSALAKSDADRNKVRCLRAYESEVGQNRSLNVPDPYYGDDSEFDRVFAICQRACRAFLATMPQ